MRHRGLTMLMVTAVSMLWSAATVWAADVVVHNKESAAQRALSETQIDTARPFQNPLAPPDTSGITPDTDPGPYAQGAMTKEGPLFSPKAFGTFGIPYTTTRVQEGNQSALGTTAANRLSTTYPYRAIGKLTFSIGGGTAFCSASLIRRSVIVTAAHCVQNFGSGPALFTGFTFRPGHYGAAGATAAQMAPYGTWTWLRVVRPAAWANGTDTGSGTARNNDLAVIALRKDASDRFVGDITGRLNYGWNNYSFVSSLQTGGLKTAAVSTLGYPGLIDAGGIMQRTDGPTYTTTVSGSAQLQQGSNFTGGSSGGPWIVNFSGRNAILSGGALLGTQSNANLVVGVTSWGAADPNAPKDNFSSQFRQNTQYPNAAYGIYGAGNIGSLLNTLCSGAAPGGGTLASTGYCD